MLFAFAVVLVVGQTTKPLSDLATFNGNVSFYTTGNTMAEALTTSTDGLACVLPSNTASVPASVFGPRATVLKAYLYYSGNVFTKGGSNTTGDLSNIDKSVSLQLPGQATALAIAPEVVHVAEFSDAAIGTPRQSYFYSARADITAAVKANATAAGQYVFSDLLTPICPDPPDAYCNPSAPVPPKCASAYNPATASFMIVIVYSDPALAPRTVKLFDGLEIIATGNEQKQVSLTGVNVSSIPKGTLTIYGLEGDAGYSGDTATVDAGRGPVSLGNDYMPAPSSAIDGIACNGAGWPNWKNNIFDSSSVLDPTMPMSGACTRGIDLDTFDISSILRPKDDHVNLTVARVGLDTFAIAFAAVGLDVFRPVLDVDSRKQILGLTGTTVEPKQTITYRVGLSNTGNIAATDVEVMDIVPKNTTNLKVLRTPPGSTDHSTPTLVAVSGITVNPGDILEVRYSVDVPCPIADGASIQNVATMKAPAIANKNGIDLRSTTLRVSDPGGAICAGTAVAVTGPTGTLFPRVLLGGAGCAAAPSSWWLLLPALAFALRRRMRLHYVLLVLVPHCTCGRFVPGPPDPVAPSGVVETKPTPPDTAPVTGTVCAADASMVSTGGTACVDRFEAVVEGGVAKSIFAAVPTANLSFNQAKAACSAAGKHLCTAAEWEKACRGTSGRLYPYGDSFAAKRCNGFDAEWGEVLQAGAMTECTSDYGTFDMSGNVSEWVDTDFPRVDGSVGKQLRGGSYLGNAAGLACTVQIGEVTDVANPYAGARCCL